MKDADLIGKGTLKAILLSGASFFALTPYVVAQEEPIQVSQDEEEDEALDLGVVRVVGLRGSLKSSMDTKRLSQGVVDSISAVDMGKFPDTNLAESLQRITGVSIDRRRGEGSRVTVRGFGPSFNIVTLNGRQVASAFVDGGSIPTSRDFDFSTIASDVLSGVDVYKTTVVSIPTGGIGSTIDVKTVRPLERAGQRAAVSAKVISDDSVTTLSEKEISPEVIAFYSDKFLDDTVGVAISVSFQNRESGFAEAGTFNGFRGFYRGTEGGWGALPTAPNDTKITNRPTGNQIYGVPQDLRYTLNDFSSERTNIGLVLQYRPIQNLTTTLDFFSSEQNAEQYKSELSVWFNHGDTTSAWGDKDVADILFYNENFGGTSDLSMASLISAVNVKTDLIGLNLEYEDFEGFSLILDVHTSTAEGKPNSPFGTAGSVSSADINLKFQGADYRSDLPVLSLGFAGDITGIDPSRMIATGSVFNSAYIKTQVDEIKIEGRYEFDSALFKSVRFGISTNNNEYRGTFGNNQRDTWGGIGSPENYPDNIWQRRNLASNFDQLSGHDKTFPEFFAIDLPNYVNALDKQITKVENGETKVIAEAICGGDGNCINDKPLVNDFRTVEETRVAYFELGAEVPYDRWVANIVSGIRLESTKVVSRGLVGIPTGTAWVAENEFYLQGTDNLATRRFTRQEGNYEYALPVIDMRFVHLDNYVFRASWGKTLTRPNYNDIRGGQVVNRIFRVDGGSGLTGNPDLKPYVSTNTDFSSEWYYDDESYFSIAYFAKKVENFIGATQVVETPFDVYTPVGGKRYNDAVNALGGSAAGNAGSIRQWIFNNAPANTFKVTETRPNGDKVGEIYGVKGEDPLLQFRITVPVNAETKNVDGWEFSWQHFLGDSGFGFIANYTILDGDGLFNIYVVPSDNSRPTPINGISDSYNLVGFYDKEGVEVRIAYNWRDKFLASGTDFGGTQDNPVFVEEFGQVDFSASYAVREQFSVFVDGINITNETSRQIGRSPSYVYHVAQTGPRYFIGGRYTF